MTESTIATDSIVQGNNEFALDLYRCLANSGSTNLFFSPYSISTALAMTFASARGKTEREMAEVLRYPFRQSLHSHLAGLTKVIFGSENSGYQAKIANRIWGQVSYKFRPEFLELLRTEYATDLEQLDFGGQATAASQRINEWIAEQTARKITALISPDHLNAMTRLLLTNAVYFKGDWTKKFEEAATKETSFHLGLLSKVKVQMMQQQSRFPYTEVGNVQVLQMPYGDESLSMVILLPRRVGGLASLEADLSLVRLKKWLGTLATQMVKVYLPRFRLTEQMALAETLRSMGMASAFSDTDADFFGMSDQKPGLYISNVIHKAFVEVNEKGTEAAAATAVLMAAMMSAAHRPPPIPVFRANHPFVFLIRHNESGSILFMGRVMDPAANE